MASRRRRFRAWYRPQESNFHHRDTETRRRPANALRARRRRFPSPCLRVSGASPKGALTLWVEVPPGQWSVGPVAGRRLGWVTDRVEALRQRPLLAAERIDGP